MYYFADKGPSSQSYGFFSSHVPCKRWTIKKAEKRRMGALKMWCCFSLDSKEIKPVNPKGNQP